MDFQMKELYPGIYHLHFETRWQVAMHFLRFQEYYESPKFADKMFSIVEYMEWYQQNHDDPNKFSYPYDWAGFNVPSRVLDEVFAADIPDWNKYDGLMAALYTSMKTENEVFYLIGTSEEAGAIDDFIDHETAHGLWATNPEYQRTMLNLIKRIRPKLRVSKSIAALVDAGYHEKVGEDEIHAYCSTGPAEWLKELLTPKVCKPFEEEFQKWKEKLSE